MIKFYLFTSIQSLGFPDVSVTLVNSRPQLKYLRGDKCPDDPNTELSSTIEFLCDVKAVKVCFSYYFEFRKIRILLTFQQNYQGVPILQEVLHNCHYFFNWPTNVICPKYATELNENTCDILNEQLNATVNLKTITKDGILTVR